MAYRLALPPALNRVHNVFHVSQLRKYISDPSHILQPEEVNFDESLSYEEHPIRILDTKVRQTRNREIRMVNVLWTNHNTEEATWEVEEQMRQKYPELFLQQKTTRNRYKYSTSRTKFLFRRVDFNNPKIFLCKIS